MNNKEKELYYIYMQNTMITFSNVTKTIVILLQINIIMIIINKMIILLVIAKINVRMSNT